MIHLAILQIQQAKRPFPPRNMVLLRDVLMLLKHSRVILIGNAHLVE